MEMPHAYRFYFGMTLIDPFRKFIIYPSLLRTVRRTWHQTFGTV